MPVPSYSQIRGKDPVWLLEIDLGGDLRRYATRTVYTADATPLLFRAGLNLGEVELGEDLERVGVTISDSEEDWVRYVARGGRITRGIGTLYLWWDGMTLDESYGILKGGIGNPTWGEPGKPEEIKLQIRGDLLDNSDPFPPPQAKVDRTTFTWNYGTENFDSNAEGRVYPVVVGYPGTGDPDEDDSTPPGSTPSYAVTIKYPASDDDAIISYGEVDASQVRIIDYSQEQGTVTSLARSSDVTVTFSTDKLGQPISLITFAGTPGAADALAHEGGEYMIGWRNASGWGGGILNADRTGPLRGLGEIILWAITKSGGQVDRGRQQAEASRLNLYKLDGLIAGGDKGRVDFLKWIEDELTTLFPIRRMRSADGVWYRRQEWNPKARDAVAHLSADTGEIERVSSFSEEPGKYNVFSLRFRMGQRVPSATRILAPDPEVLEPFTGVDERVIGSPKCKASVALYGERIEAPEVGTDIIWSYDTARAILSYWADRDALPHQLVSYSGPNLEYLQPGDIITITDSSAYLTSRPAIVDSMTVGGPVVTLSLILPWNGEYSTS